MRAISRRTALLGALGIAFAGCSSGDDGPDVATGPLVSGSFRSTARGTDVGWSVSYPPGHASDSRLPVLVALHGRGGGHDDAFAASLHLDRYLAQAVDQGMRPYAIAAADGGDHDYWHPRATGDPAAMITDEFLPLLAERGLDTRRIALLGWSMGGYGALYLGGVLRHRVAALVAESPAIWHEAGQSVEGAFDDAEDFRRHRIFGRLGRLRGIAMRVDCGSGDSFAPVTRDLRAALSPTPAGGIEPGGHDSPFWRAQAPAQLRFVGANL